MRDIRLLTLVGALFFVALGFSAPMMTLYLQDLGASFVEISLILTTFTATALLANFASGYLSDRVHRRKPFLIGGILLVALAYIGLARAPSAGLAWAVRIVEGIGSGAYGTLSLAMMGDLLHASARRGRRMGTFRGIGSAAFALGAFAGGWIIARSSIPTLFMVAAVFFLSAAVVALFVHEPEAAALAAAEPALPTASTVPALPAASTVPALPAAAKDRLPGLFLAAVFLWTASVTAVASMWPNAMAQLGYSKQAISSLWGYAALIEMPGMQAAGILSDSLGRVPLLVVGAVGMALAYLGYLLLARWLPALIGVQTLRGLAYGSALSTSMTYAAEHGSRRTRGSVSGLYTAVTSGGQMAGQLTSGSVVQVAGFAPLFALCALASVVSGVLFLNLRQPRPAAAAASSVKVDA